MTQLPEKIMWDETSMSSLDAYMSETINLIINYLKEREEPVLTPVAEAVRSNLESEFASKAKYHEDFTPDEYNTGTIDTSYYLIYAGEVEKMFSPTQEK